MRLKLTIEPIPVSAWGKSLANLLPRKEWDELRTQCYREADYKCEICGNTTQNLHCHEVWKFNETKKIMALFHLQCLCELCHSVKHIGRSEIVNGRRYKSVLIEHWCSVNGLTKRDFLEYEEQIRTQNIKRANRYYQIRVGRRILC